MSFSHDMEYHSARMQAEQAKERYYEELRIAARGVDLADLAADLKRAASALDSIARTLEVRR